MNATQHSDSEHRGYERELFSVQGERVTLDAQHGWQCTCTPNAVDLQCLHVEQAQALKKMRGVPREADTIELQLSAAELQALSRAAEAAHAPLAPMESLPMAKRTRRQSPWATIAIAAAMSAITSGITYLATARSLAGRTAEPVHISHAVAVPRTPPSSLPPEVPVKVINPFDATEIFEFPPGTNETGARDSVAEFLLNRARARQAAVEVAVRAHKNAERERLDRAMRLAEAG